MEEFIYYIEVRSEKNEFVEAKLVDETMDIKPEYSILWNKYPACFISIYRFNRESLYNDLCNGYQLYSVKNSAELINPFEL